MKKIFKNITESRIKKVWRKI